LEAGALQEIISRGKYGINKNKYFVTVFINERHDFYMDAHRKVSFSFPSAWGLHRQALPDKPGQVVRSETADFMPGRKFNRSILYHKLERSVQSFCDIANIEGKKIENDSRTFQSRI
jgi:hypothetical protein